MYSVYDAVKEVKGSAVKRGHASQFSVYNGAGCGSGCQGNSRSTKTRGQEQTTERESDFDLNTIK